MDHWLKSLGESFTTPSRSSRSSVLGQEFGHTNPAQDPDRE